MFNKNLKELLTFGCALTVVLILTACEIKPNMSNIMFSTFENTEKTEEPEESVSDELNKIDKVNSRLRTFQEETKNVNRIEKIDLANAMFEDLEKEGLVQNVHYDRKAEFYSFNYFNGYSGGLILKEFNSTMN